jgi:two-component system nitrogen regulation response regulator GlnG
MRILIVDDEPAIRRLLLRALEGLSIDEGSFVEAATRAEAEAIIDEALPDFAILDVVLPDGSGLDLLATIKQRDARVPTIVITAAGDSQTAIEAMKRGAFDYLQKPLDIEHVRRVAQQAVNARRLMLEPAVVGSTNDSANAYGALIGRSTPMQEVYKSIGRVASRNVGVLIRGESGTGKELVARAIYQFSDRSEKPFLAVNCAAIPDALLESELFGHEKGAFTGADRQRIGRFEQCSGGTLFLDEIGDMPLSLQSKMLRVLQDQVFQRVGGNETIRTDVRIIAATHRDLRTLSEENLFRADLYYRLNVFEISLPPLRDRIDDLPLLIETLLAQANQELETNVEHIAPETMTVLERYSWPGNVRELQSVLKQGVLRSGGGVISTDCLPTDFDTLTRAAPTNSPGDDWLSGFVASRIKSGSKTIYDEAVARLEKALLLLVLRETEGNQVQAARFLGINRKTVRNKIRQFGISTKRHLGEPDGG